MRIAGRYEIRGVIGEGGMGIVYRAQDLNLDTEVAVKTIRNPHDAASLELFKKEGAVLRSLNHPNIVEIRDVGEYQDEQGANRPYLVMPFLPGVTLDKIIEKQPGRLTPERVIEMMIHVCRGLQAAHEARLIHRDLKPSNLFVFDDDSVKIIDFGIAHLVDQRSTVGGKGTLEYMSPEQVSLGKLTPESDIFSLGVICFECLTRRRPFAARTPDEVVTNIQKATPPPISDLNHKVSVLLSQVIQLAMAKRPERRYHSAREFAECLQKGLRNESIDRFNPAGVAPLLVNVRHALEASHYEDAQDILNVVEDDGYLHPEIPALRRQVDLALRNRRLGLLLESANRLFDRQEYPLVIEKLQRVLDEDPAHPEANKLMAAAEGKRQQFHYDKWIRVAEEHLDNHSFVKAREAAERAREADTTDRVLELLAKIERREREYQEIRREKEELYQSALEQRRNGNLTQAADRLERLISLDKRSPEKTSPDRGAAYEKSFNEVRSERDAIDHALSEAKKYLNGKDYAAAQAICDPLLEKYPRHAVIRGLRLQISERQQLDLSEYIAKVDSEASREPDPDRKVALYEEALRRFPDEVHFSRRLAVICERRDEIHAHVKEARNKEERGQYAEALNLWENVKTLCAEYPGLAAELDRVRLRRDDQAREEEKSAAVSGIRRLLLADQLDEAALLAAEAQAERPGDREIRTLAELAQNRKEKAAQAGAYRKAGLAAKDGGDLEQAIHEFRQAFETGEEQLISKARLLEALVARSKEVLDRDPAKAAELAQEAVSIDGSNPRAGAHLKLVVDRGRGRDVDEFLNRAGVAQERGDANEALRLVDEGLQRFPGTESLLRYRETLREAHLDQAKALRQSMRQAPDPAALNSIFGELEQVTGRHGSDPRFTDLAKQAGSEKEQLGKTMGVGTQVLGAAAGVGANPQPRVRVPVKGPVKEAHPAPVNPRPVSPVPQPRKKLVDRVPKTVWMGAAGFGLVAVVLAIFVFALKPRPKAVPRMKKPPVLAEVLKPVAVAPASADKPGFLINLEAGTVELRGDSGKPGVIKERGTPVDIDPGAYDLTVRDQVGQTFSAKITIEPDGQIALSKVNYSPGMLTTVLAISGGQARLFGAKVAGLTKDGVQAVPPEGMLLALPDNSTLWVGSTKLYPYHVLAKATDRPIIQVHVRDTTKGLISICELPPGATVDLVRIDGKGRPLQLQASQNGCGVVELQIGEYRVSASAEGWAPGKSEAKVDSGPETKVKLPLRQLPGVILVTNAEPGAEVLISEVRKGQVGDDGKARIETQPGNQAIRLRKRNFDSAPAVAIKVEPGKQLIWSGAGQLTPKKFEIAIHPTPNTAAVFLKRNGKEERVEGGRTTLEAGEHWFVARADGYAPKELSQTIGDDLPKTIELALTRIQTVTSSAARPVAKILGIGCLKDAATGCGPFPGRFEFTARLKRGMVGLTSRSFEWYLATNGGRQNFKLEKEKMSLGKERRNHSVPLEDDVTVACDVQSRSVQCRLNNSEVLTFPSAVDLTGSRLGVADFKSLSVVPAAK